ncbi:glycosyl transferase [Alteromonas sp. KUL42]|uniref:glycosyltransferase family 2 protein n=1 Tax=Alteromonas sp. KUL42 TaxID=2480797 RepID=UPI001036C177|nr:glycosyltransferase family 2 protein [Alteromonas sp. KUL42]TAP35556.1 glycosyltransferase [Alteromonas sp. KUL42]GEA07029.1 glycosyl transferase [Alteromonas sp. KUL42]
MLEEIDSNPKLSVVSTLYQSSNHIDEFYSRLVACCSKLTESFEIILVNDGATDDSLEKAKVIADYDPRVTVIDLSRNFGHHKAMMVGLAYCKGERIFLIDSDLEESPELLLQFSNSLDENSDLDMVYGIQKKRKGGFFERVSGTLFYRTVNSLVDIPIPENFLTVRLMTRRFVKELCRYEERELNFSTLIALCGFRSKAIAVHKGHKQQTSYTIGKKFQILVNTITSASSKPLWIIFVSGLLITTVSIITIFYILFEYIFHGIGLAGWTSLIVSIWLLGGLLIMSVGTIGIYLSKIFIEVKQRPYVNIREVIKRREPNDEY